MSNLGTGYNDKAKLAAALELAKSFKKAGPEPKGGTKAKKVQGQREVFTSNTVINSYKPHPLPPKPGNVLLPRQRNVLPPRQSNVPPPSQRFYKHTLTGEPFHKGPGPILGTRAMDFLTRGAVGPSQKEKAAPSMAQAPQTPKQMSLPTPSPTPQGNILDRFYSIYDDEKMDIDEEPVYHQPKNTSQQVSTAPLVARPGNPTASRKPTKGLADSRWA
ncbi:hypothetical protein G7046_g4824 [Stylonectria norvegica]|nr:hypothetical protein G7046_g4824 [Stylonectria norvegica]